jgi:hypothetical protein
MTAFAIPAPDGLMANLDQRDGFWNSATSCEVVAARYGLG